VPVLPGSPYAGRSIATAGVRSITGVSIVAVLRADAAFPSPGPDFRLEVGDTALVVGTPDGVEALVELLED
jgi:TrkA domain protein